jgi:hypothetical protein
MVVFLKEGRWVRANAVERPKTPDPTIKILLGGGEAIVVSVCEVQIRRSRYRYGM